MARPHLLNTILAALVAAGCATEDTAMCLQVAGDAESCPAADDVDPADLFHTSDCDLEARRVTGEAERFEAGLWTEDSGQDAADLCCYPVVARDPTRFSECAVGRPYIEGEAATVAPIVAGPGWATAPEGAEIAPELAAAWRRMAAMEHASIAAFARLTLELMAHGAPASLLADVQAAAADEVRHARSCFAQASRHAGHALRPGPFPFAGPITVRSDLAAIAADAAAEGCVGETVGAALAAASARNVSTTLRQADRETREQRQGWTGDPHRVHRGQNLTEQTTLWPALSQLQNSFSCSSKAVNRRVAAGRAG